MSVHFSEFSPYIVFLTPPLIGAFIGYLTNRVAIRMLFRPLKKWRIGPFGVPMTPGVIPSKRHELAINIGEMVGEHLLTSDEINNSLIKDRFQEHLYQLIEAKVGSFMKKDLGPLPSLIPSEYSSYFDIARKTLTYQIKETVAEYLSTDRCKEAMAQSAHVWFETFLEREINAIASPAARDSVYDSIGLQIQRLFHSEITGKWVEEYIDKKLYETSNNDTSLRDIIPPSIIGSIIEIIDRQTPELLDQGVKILKEPQVQQRIIDEILIGIEEFIETLGPMSTMIQNFLDMSMVEEKIKEYFSEKEDEIHTFLTGEDIRSRVSKTLTQRAQLFFDSSLRTIVSQQKVSSLQSLGAELSSVIITSLRKPETTHIINNLVKNHVEKQTNNGACPLGEVVLELLGDSGVEHVKGWISREVSDVLSSPETKKVIDSILESMIEQLMQRPIGRLDNLVPAGVRDGLFKSLQDMATRMLTSEVPGIVKSLNIKQIVTDRIDSFDLLRLERLLLSIMEEQFKYINIFGGLLGFLIGCINILFVTGIVP